MATHTVQAALQEHKRNPANPAREEKAATRRFQVVLQLRERVRVTLPDAFVSRRVVDFGVMRDRVRKGCDVCGRRLEVWKHCVGERRVGLASELHVECSRCGAVNDVATSKSHAVKRRSMSDVSDTSEVEPAAKRTYHCGGKIYDVNTKAALGE